MKPRWIAGGSLAAALMLAVTTSPAMADTYWISPFYTSDHTTSLGGCTVSGDMQPYWIHAYEVAGDLSGDVGTRGVFAEVELSIVWGEDSVTQHYPNCTYMIQKYKLYHY